MKSRLLCTLLLCVSGFIHAQSTVNDSFVYDSINRTYSIYIPASYIQGQPVPLLLDLHGLGSNGSQQYLYSNFMPIADTANFILVHPDGTVDPIVNTRYWNIGIPLSDVDDVGFLEALIDTISQQYSINPKRIYSTGMSNGGYMSFYLACHSNRFAAVGSVTGSMLTSIISNCTPDYPIPTIQIHGTADSTVPYNGNSTSEAISDVIAYWVNVNGCDTIPTISLVPDINQSDNATAERYLYSNGINGNTIEHFKVLNGGHTWPGAFPLPGQNTCLDFNASEEIWRFFSQYELPASASNKELPKITLRIWPNPTSGLINLSSKNKTITKIEIVDVMGRVVYTRSGKNIKTANLSGLKNGSYFARIFDNHFITAKKLIIWQ